MKTKLRLISLIGVLVIFALMALGSGTSSTRARHSSSYSRSSSASTTEERDDGTPREYRNALSKAKFYSEHMHMSKQGIYEQLTSEYGEKFPADAAQYAVDHLQADYNANALAKARFYSDEMHMSKSGVYDQLTSEYGEKFTSSQAQYAVDHL